MAITKDEVVEYLKGITLLEASELVKELEEVFGVSAAAAAAPMMMAAPGGDDEEVITFDLEPGTYALLCFIPSADGTPHTALGMHAELIVD